MKAVIINKSTLHFYEIGDVVEIIQEVVEQLPLYYDCKCGEHYNYKQFIKKTDLQLL